MELPVSFKQFSKDPTKAILYLALIAIIYLYVDNKVTQADQIKYLMEQNTTKDIKIEKLQDDITTLSIKIADLSKK